MFADKGLILQVVLISYVVFMLIDNKLANYYTIWVHIAIIYLIIQAENSTSRLIFVGYSIYLISVQNHKWFTLEKLLHQSKGLMIKGKDGITSEMKRLHDGLGL
jgi:hypothetical protein